LTEPTTSASGPIRFGVFQVNLHTGELWKNGNKIKLEGQPFQILALLLERPGELVTREELEQKLWAAGTFVDFEHGINTAVKRLREVLGDSADSAHFIETLPRRGYRFIFPVDGAPAVAAIRPPARSWLARWVVASLGIAAVLGILLAANFGGLRERLLPLPVAPRIESLTVLPLENLTGDPEQEYLVDGIHDELITQLAQISSLKVISRYSAIQIRQQKGKSLREIARELGVEAVIEGTVQRAGERIHLGVQLIRAQDDRHLWARSYECDLRDILSLQREVAREIAREIKVELTPREQAHLARARPLNPEAYELYLKGRFLLSQWGAQENIWKAIAYFDQAVQKEPTYAAAHAGRAFAYLQLGAALVEAVPPREILPKARAAGLKALEMDETSSEAYEVLGWIALAYDWDWEGAERAFRRAIELNPSYPPPYMWLSQYMNVAGQHQGALALIRRAQQLDPLSPHIQWSLAETSMLAGALEQSAEQCEKGLDLHPDFWPLHTLLGEIYLRQGKYDRALANLERGVEISKRHPHALSVLGSAYALAGRRPESLNILAELRKLSQRRYLSPANIARVYASLGENEQALSWLEKAYNDRSSWMTRIHLWGPALGNLPADPRFQDLLRRMNFPQQEAK
jgi:TolB-like protein/DNA-binding winged helix-turn-helix (wHTH) protein/Flp pilus assembly protein TadD